MDLGDIEKPKETLSECQHHLLLLRELRDLASWDLLCRYFSDSASHIERSILGVSVAPDMIYQQEFMKGRANALRNIKNYVDEYCETLEGNINRIVSLMRDEEEENDSARRDHTFDYRASSSINGADADQSESESRPAVP